MVVITMVEVTSRVSSRRNSPGDVVVVREITERKRGAARGREAEEVLVVVEVCESAASSTSNSPPPPTVLPVYFSLFY